MPQFDWTNWTEWENLTELDLRSLPTGPGAYVLSTGTPIRRVIGKDDLGILDIGESGRLRGRLRSFLRCARRRGNC